MLAISLVLVILTILFFAARYLAKAYRERKTPDQEIGKELKKHNDSLQGTQPDPGRLQKNKYLPSSKNNEVDDDNSLLGRESVTSLGSSLTQDKGPSNNEGKAATNNQGST